MALQDRAVAPAPAPAFAPMETGLPADAAMFGMGAFGGDDVPANFSLAVNQVMAGLDPARPSAPAPAPTVSTSSSAAAPAAAAAAPAAVSAPMPPHPGVAGAAGLPLPSGPPASRKRGLAYAQLVKTRAREDFKDRRRQELEEMGEGDRTKRRKKNDTSMTERQKYRRRLQKNQDSAAAARHAQEAYIANLEEQVGRYDADMNAVCAQLRRVEAERDEYMRISQMALDTNKHLEIQIAYLREENAAARAAAPAAPAVVESKPAGNSQDIVPEWETKGDGELDFKNTMFEMFSAANYGNPDFSEFLSGCKPPPAV